MSPQLFGCNVPHYLIGVGNALTNYSDHSGVAAVRSSAAPLAQAMRGAGCKMLRFPGGTSAQHYIPDDASSGMRAGGYEASAFSKTAIDNFTSNPGLFEPGSWTHGWYPRIADFLQFCADFGFEPLWQINPTLWKDPLDGQIHAATYTQWVVKKAPEPPGRQPPLCSAEAVDPSLLISSDPRYAGRIVVERDLSKAAGRAAAVLNGQLVALTARGIALPKTVEIGNEGAPRLIGITFWGLPP